MSRREARKGAGGELEVAAIFAEHFPSAGIERAKRGRQLGQDLVRVPGSIVSVKRHEVLRIPAWVREADATGERLGVLPILAYRTNAGGACPGWRGDVPLEQLAKLLAAREALRELVAEVGRGSAAGQTAMTELLEWRPFVNAKDAL